MNIDLISLIIQNVEQTIESGDSCMVSRKTMKVKSLFTGMDSIFHSKLWSE